MTTRKLSTATIKLTTLPVLSPDSRWAVYLDAQGVWSVPVAGGAPVRLFPNASARFVISPDSQRVVFVSDQGTPGVPDLWSVPIASGTVVRLTDLHALPGQVIDFAISPDSQRVYWTGDLASNNKIEMWRSPILGGTATRINASVDSDYDIFGFLVTPSDRVVYRVGRTVQGGHELWSVAGTGTSAQARRISISPMVTGGGVASDFRISEDGSRAVYRADAEHNGSEWLYSSPVVGGATIQLSSGAGRVSEFGWGTPAGSGIAVYAERIGTVTKWWSVPVMGGTPTPATPPTQEPVTSPDGLWTVYPVGSSLWSDGPGGVQMRVSCAGQVVTATFLTKPTYSVSGDSRSVLYVADGELWHGPVSGAVCALFVNGFEDGTMGGWQ